MTGFDPHVFVVYLNIISKLLIPKFLFPTTHILLNFPRLTEQVPTPGMAMPKAPRDAWGQGWGQAALATAPYLSMSHARACNRGALRCNSKIITKLYFSFITFFMGRLSKIWQLRHAIFFLSLSGKKLSPFHLKEVLQSPGASIWRHY